MNPESGPGGAASRVILSARSIGILLAALGAILFAAKAVVVKLTYRYDVDAVTVIAFRMAFSLPFFLAIGWYEARRARRGLQPRLTRRDSLQLAALGLMGYYLSSFLDFIGLQYISAGLERLILFLAPTMVLLISAFWLGRQISRAQWVALALSYAGVVLVFAHDVSFGGDHVLKGSLFVLGSALTYALYLIGSGELIAKVGATRLVAYAMTVSSLACIVQFFVVHGTSQVIQPMPVYGWSVVHATLNTVAPVFMIMWAVARVGAPTTSQVGMIGPVSVLFLAAWLLDEPITVWQLAGTVLVMAGVFVLSVRRKR
ncbi:Permease of the drug/metabolite transporter (DMT) superfamily [plant metagenome]|uniref:Permease of the drug/metabolite transporter (DMT) superfamily n=1 Tax=plant metagenome TaxID=1297885 RepID=A0A484QIA2_9ZZZZ